MRICTRRAVEQKSSAAVCVDAEGEWRFQSIADVLGGFTTGFSHAAGGAKVKSTKSGCRHMECLWFANLANNLLWWAYVKAAWRSLMARLFFCCSQITFKATAKVPACLISGFCKVVVYNPRDAY